MTDQPLPPGDDEAAELFSHLREMVYRRPPVGARGQWPSVAREEAERLWPVSAERPFLEASGGSARLRGVALRPAKAVLRRLMRWYVEPPLADQRRFNAAILQLLDELTARTAANDQDADDAPPRADPGA
jgi:hypothetical protein